MSKANDLTGRTFGLLKVLRRVEDVKPGRPMWLCECRCGKSSLGMSMQLRERCFCSLRKSAPLQNDILRL